jgi:2-phosphosulfolactate phosphatase
MPARPPQARAGSDPAHACDAHGIARVRVLSQHRVPRSLGHYNASMKIERRRLLQGAEQARGIVVIIDVLRAFSCSALMFHYGIRDMALVKRPEDALAFRQRDPEYLVSGEVKGVKVDGFDLGNSPADIVARGERFFRGRRVAVRSSAGTQGVLAAAANAELVMLGSYMNAAATAAYIRDRAHVEALTGGCDTVVTLVAMGLEGVRPSVEDERCGDYLEHLLNAATESPRYDHLQAVWECMQDAEIAASLRGEHAYRPKEDIVLALQRDLFDFVMVGRREEGHVRVTRQPVSV